MATKLFLEHPATGITKIAPVGYSVTTLFFGPVPALLRGDFKWFFIMGILSGTGLVTLLFPFIYNKLYVKKLLEKGFRVVSAEGDDLANIKRKLKINFPILEKG